MSVTDKLAKQRRTAELAMRVNSETSWPEAALQYISAIEALRAELIGGAHEGGHIVARVDKIITDAAPMLGEK